MKKFLSLFFIALLVIFTACNASPELTTVDEIKQNDESGDLNKGSHNNTKNTTNEANGKNNENNIDSTVERNGENYGEVDKDLGQPSRFDKHNGSNNYEPNNGRDLELPMMSFE